jgi:hypothetical protein
MIFFINCNSWASATHPPLSELSVFAFLYPVLVHSCWTTLTSTSAPLSPHLLVFLNFPFNKLHFSFSLFIRVFCIAFNSTPLIQRWSVNQHFFTIIHRMLFYVLINLILKLTHIRTSTKYSKEFRIITGKTNRIELLFRKIVLKLWRVDREPIIVFMLHNIQWFDRNLSDLTMLSY